MGSATGAGDDDHRSDDPTHEAPVPHGPRGGRDLGGPRPCRPIYYESVHSALFFSKRQ